MAPCTSTAGRTRTSSGAIGGYGGTPPGADARRAQDDATSWLQFDESEPEAAAQRAILRREGLETTTLLDGSTVSAERVQLAVDGRASNAHWCVDGVVVKSDWCGAHSYLSHDPEALRAGLDPEVAARIEEFAAR